MKIDLELDEALFIWKLLNDIVGKEPIGPLTEARMVRDKLQRQLEPQAEAFLASLTPGGNDA